MNTHMKKLTKVQRAILENIEAGRRYDYGRPFTRSAAAGWGCSIDSCVRHGWLDRRYEITPAGLSALKGKAEGSVGLSAEASAPSRVSESDSEITNGEA